MSTPASIVPWAKGSIERAFMGIARQRDRDPRAAQYRADAATALRQAMVFRDHWRRTGLPTDRVLMRGFALAWRNYRRLYANATLRPLFRPENPQP